MSEVKAVQIESGTPRNPGEFAFRARASDNVVNLMVFCCPCGCGDLGRLRLRVAGEEVIHPSWEWNGNRESPTLSPSILTVVGCKYHGFLTNGVWRDC